MTFERPLRPLTFMAAMLLSFAACAASPPVPAAHAEFYRSTDAALKALPFSEAVRAGDFLFVSGEIGALPGKLVLAPGGITGEARQAIENVRDILRRHGATLGDVVRCTVFLADMKDWPAFNTVYREYFKPPFPARSATGATALALGARVELECMAYVPVASK
ncbi:RidA family protein [Rhodanobacter ginsengisoli]|uniref:RidA family protein n=1 Tax=Rhodanobacter ginsengisoli TaxID=418646 RepID=A0ABW0QQ14_9GAMM